MRPPSRWPSFVGGVAVLVIVFSVVYSSVASERTLQAERADNAAERAAASRERADAARERDRLLAGQDDLNAKYEALLEWVNSLGYPVPDYVLNAGRGNDDGDGSNDDDDGSSSTEGSGKQSPPKSGPATTQPQRQPNDRPGQGADRPSGGGGQGRDRGDRGSDRPDRPDTGSDKGSEANKPSKSKAK